MDSKGFYPNGFDGNTQIAPRESVEHEWDVEANRVANEHEITVATLNVDAKRQLMLLQREDATKSRLHAEQMKEMDLAIKKLDVQLKTWFRIPILIIKLPVLILFGIAYIVAVARGREINSSEFWRFITN